MAEDNLELVKTKKEEMQSLLSRMDADKDLVFGGYKMKNLDGQETPQVINVTMNKARVFGMRATAILSAAIQQAVVEGKDISDTQCAYIEDFQDDMNYEIDNRLSKRGLTGMFPFSCEQANYRGRIAGRCILREEKGVFVPDVIPLDTRFFFTEEGADKMIWGAFETTRSRARLKQEYGKDIGRESEVVTDFWNSDINEVFIGDEKIKQDKNKYGYPPFVLSIVPSGSMLQDADMLEHRGESIFFPNRDVYPHYNFIASVLQTLTVMSFRGAMQFGSEAGPLAQKPEKPPFGVDVVIPTGLQDFFRQVPVNDINNAARLMYSMLEGALQQGSLSDIFYGNLRFPLSGAALHTIFEPANMIFLPRLQALATYYQELHRMVIKQFIALGKTLKLGENQREYLPKQLEGTYTLKYTYFSTSPLQDMANVSTAQAYGGLISDDTKRREILKIKDPDGEMQKIRDEMAEKLDPAIMLRRTIESLLEQKKDEEAALLIESLALLLMQRRGGGQPMPQGTAPGEKRKGIPEEALPLFGGGGGGRSPAPPSGEEAAIAETAEREGEI